MRVTVKQLFVGGLFFSIAFGCGCGNRKVHDESSEYRALVGMYRALRSNDNGQSPKAPELRERIVKLCQAILDKHSQMGLTMDQVERLLGPPAAQMQAAQLYWGMEYSWFYVLIYENGKLVSYHHERTFDLEGGK